MADKRIYDCLVNEQMHYKAELEQIEIDINALIKKNILIKLKFHYENILQDNVHILNYVCSYDDSILNIKYNLEYNSEKYKIVLYKNNDSASINVYNGTVDLIYSLEYINIYKTAIESCDSKITKIMKSTCVLYNDNMVLFFTYPF